MPSVTDSGHPLNQLLARVAYYPMTLEDLNKQRGRAVELDS